MHPFSHILNNFQGMSNLLIPRGDCISKINDLVWSSNLRLDQVTLIDESTWSIIPLIILHEIARIKRNSTWSKWTFVSWEILAETDTSIIFNLKE